MAFNFQVIRGSTTYTFYGSGQPIRLESVDDLGGAGVRNIEESGPYQDGATHLDYRLEPITLTLRFVVVGASASALDGHRDTLNEAFKPVRGVPIILKVTRDDGKIYQLDSQRTGRLSIPLVSTNRPGNLHRAVVQLRAANPLWYDPVEEELAVTPPAGDPWYTAGGSIPGSAVLISATNPTQGQQWTGVGSVGSSNPYTIFFRSAQESLGGTTYAFALSYLPNGGMGFRTSGSLYVLGNGLGVNIFGSSLMTAGTHNYMIVNNGSAVTLYRDTVSLGTNSDPARGFNVNAGRWRSDSNGLRPWANELPLAALYNIALDSDQRAALHDTTNSTATPIVTSGTISYDGDYATYPVITIAGPISNPVITNQTTGETLSFFGGAIADGESWTIDTRYGRKSATDANGNSVLQYISDDSNLATFHIEASPLAAGGTNILVFGGEHTGTATSIEISYNARYMGF